MSILEIKQKADQLYKQNKEQMIPHFFFVGYISILAQYLQSGLFSFFVAIFLCSMSHGYVKCAMKIVNEEKPELTSQDSMIGILEFTRVFSVYFVRKIIIVVLIGLSMLPTILSFTYITPLFTLEWIMEAGNTLIQTELFIPNEAIILPLVQNMPLVVNALLSGILYLLLNSLLSFMPYIMEEDEFSWSEALHKSFHIMKGRLMRMVHLYLSYGFRYLTYWLVTALIAIVIGSINEVLMLICLVFSLFFYIDVVKGRIEIAKYLLYKEFIREDENNE